VTALLSRGLVCEEITASHAKADAALNTLWRNQENGRGILLRITPEGIAALGIEPDSGDEGAVGAAPAAGDGAQAGTASGRRTSRLAGREELAWRNFFWVEAAVACPGRAAAAIKPAMTLRDGCRPPY
jgi:hypothetical protein